jgi:hypothetical protein
MLPKIDNWRIGRRVALAFKVPWDGSGLGLVRTNRRRLARLAPRDSAIERGRHRFSVMPRSPKGHCPQVLK